MKQLKDFQRIDAEHVAGRKSALVAHEPRVGKSGIGIHAANILRAKIVVVVSPAAVIENWSRAIDDFRHEPWTAFIVSYAKLGDFIPRLRSFLKSHGFLIDVLIVDEAHYAKNRDSARTKHVYGSQLDGIGGLVELAERVYCLTGTPMPNDPTELYPMLRAIAPGLIDNGNGRPMTATQFKMRYCRMSHTPFGMKVVGSKNYIDLKRRMDGFLLRRTRRDVFGRDIPEPQMVYLNAAHADKAALRALQTSEDGKRIADALERGGIRALLREEAHAAGIRKAFGMMKVAPVVSLIREELDLEPDKKQVLFAWHTSVIDGLAEGLRKYGALVFDGRVSKERKVRIQDAFRDKRQHRVVIGQITAMGLGLDFSASDDCLMVEQSWVQTDNDQAQARIFNMASMNPKFVRWALLSGSVDEQIVKACMRKDAMSRKILD